MSDEKSIFKRYLPFIIGLFAIFGTGSGIYNLIKQDVAYEKEVEGNIMAIVKPTIELNGYYVDVIWESMTVDTIGGDGIPQIIHNDIESRVTERMYIVAPSPTTTWIGKYFRPEWPDKLDYSPKFVYNIRKVKSIRTGNKDDLESDSPEDQ